MRKTRIVNIPITKGADFQVYIKVPTGGLPTDLTGYTFDGQIRSTSNLISDPVAAFTFVIQDQNTKKGKVLWKLARSVIAGIPISIINSEMEDFEPTPYLYDVFMTDTLGLRTKVLQGRAFVIPSSTT